jgi:hypothetical protein
METRLPILIGVTGHRDLRTADEARLRTAVGDVFDAITRDLPNSPLTVLTALAEGSDRLVAREALRRGCSLIVPLPMPRKIYTAEFGSAESRAEFNELLERAERSFELPLVRGGDRDSPALDHAARSVQYQQLGVFLVRHAQILIALWDGRMSDDPGGTAHVVEINLRGGQSKRFIGSHEVSFDDLDPWDRGPCYHVVTPRESCLTPEGSPFETRALFPDPVDGRTNAPERHRAILGRIDLFNEQITKGGDLLETEAKDSAGDLLPEEPHERLSTKEHELLHRFGLADALAKRMQRRYRWSLATLLALVLLALASFEAYDNLFPEEGTVDLWSLLLLAAYPVALTVAFIGYVLAKRGGIQDMHIDYRALAEGIRVQLFWRMGGLRHEVSDHYLRKQTGELRWIHEAIRVSNVPTGGQEIASREESLGSGERVLQYWIEAQRAYYVRAAGRDATRLRRGSRLATTFYIGSLGSTVVVLVMDGLARLQIASDLGAGMRPTLFMGIALMLGLSVLIRAYSEKMGFSEQAVQYQRMRDLFMRAERSLKSGLGRGDVDAVQDVLVELGEEALQENADWVLLRRSRGIEIPQGG